MQFLRYLPATSHESLAGSKQRGNPRRLQITGCNLALFSYESGGEQKQIPAQKG